MFEGCCGMQNTPYCMQNTPTVSYPGSGDYDIRREKLRGTSEHHVQDCRDTDQQEKNSHYQGDGDREWDFIADQVFVQQLCPLRAQLKHELDVIPYAHEEQKIPEQNQCHAKPARGCGGQGLPYENCFTYIAKELKDGEAEAEQRECGTNDGHQRSVRTHSGAMERECRSRR